MSDAVAAATARGRGRPRSVVVRNLANLVSVLGVLPACVLFLPGGMRFVVPFIVFNNVMDDLDGWLAAKLRIQSTFGAKLDNVCDGVAHTVVVLMVALPLGGVCSVAGLLAAAAIWIRGRSRIEEGPAKNGGSPTNELMRHLLFVLLLSATLGFDPALPVAGVCLANTVSMLLPYRLPGLLRSLARSTVAIAGVNAALILAWLVPASAPAVAAVFGATYLYGLAVGSWRRLRAPAPATASSIGDARTRAVGPPSHRATV